MAEQRNRLRPAPYSATGSCRARRGAIRTKYRSAEIPNPTNHELTRGIAHGTELINDFRHRNRDQASLDLLLKGLRSIADQHDQVVVTAIEVEGDQLERRPERERLESFRARGFEALRGRSLETDWERLRSHFPEAFRIGPNDPNDAKERKISCPHAEALV